MFPACSCGREAGGVEQTQRKKRRRLLAGLSAAAVLWWGREWVWLVLRQLLPGALTALAAFPLARRLEKRLSPGASAAAAVIALCAALIAALLWLVPVLAEQGRQLLAMLPGLWENAVQLSLRLQQKLAAHGFETGGVQEMLLERGREAIGAVVPALFSRLGGVAGGVSQWLLAPVFGFYFLRDRQLLSARLLQYLPDGWRRTAGEMFREIRRETAAYLKGQLFLSAAVGALSAAGLLACGIPSWLALGAAMAVLELIPYAGPIIGAAAAALFALPLGWWRALWAVGVIVLVQQAEASFLSPRLISRTTQLHPAVVILCAVVGGAAAGITGMLAAVPLVLCVRAALRVLVLQKNLFK